jgi:predicted TIM-barrel fold metal-dependent hydrolase
MAISEGTDRGRSGQPEPEDSKKKLRETIRPIDTDVHENLSTTMDLAPYLAKEWVHYITPREKGGYGWKAVVPGVPWATGYPAHRREDWRAPTGGDAVDLPRMVRDLIEKEGVATPIICGDGNLHVSSMDGWYEFAAALGSAYNDYQIEQWLEKEPRLRGSVHVVAQDPAQAAREIDRVGGHPQIVQVFLPLATNRHYGDPHYRPIFEAAIRNKLTVVMHHDAFTKSPLGHSPYFVEWHSIALPSAMMAQLTSMIYGGLFDKYPDLMVCGLEAGFTWMPFLMSRLDRQYSEFRHEIPWVKRRPSDHLKDHVRLSTQPMEQFTAGNFQKLIGLMESEDMLMFSSDYPHFDADSVEHSLPAGIPEGLYRKIVHDNAANSYPKLHDA